MKAIAKENKEIFMKDGFGVKITKGGVYNIDVRLSITNDSIFVVYLFGNSIKLDKCIFEKYFDII